ncbi:Glycosyltransferase, catalytic subunit of cellulose synthase and poly-beta-1,6-N-acetylglucosamine synthase [Geodermatophilus dictyosporus]|uniref:4,4'-diaponeurosporenoate glycosyltransferase n=1 Tax=Geodermatophilus dictyosporus TaxID=1523247 RepID=A0A1I5MWD8_9ACTN|nr:glycosyltransferase [Geodermatophilus dictyosporus]SFP13824.1 Glycosyltransferase, catalytic subunit of cellulose synthase and poly-beta-1,6-N-acetylglucosamine synthase [Geodermatophilus dictyosporus]
MSDPRRRRALVASGALFLVGPVLPLALAATERLLGRTGSYPTPEPLPEDPFVEVVVPAYLEESTVGATVEVLTNALEKSAVRHLVHVVASDEGTAASAAAAGKVTRTGRGGKPAAVNAAVEQSTADVVVLTDANCRIEPPDWPVQMLRELQDTSLLSANKTEVGSDDVLFWRLESWLKLNASSDGGTLGVVGEFLAMRRRDYRPVPPATTSDDLWLAMDFDARGLRVSVSPTIVTCEDPAPRPEQWERRVRIAYGQLVMALPRLRALSRTPAGRNYLAHKMYRLTVGAAAFWTALAALVSVRPRVLVPVVGVPVGAAVAQYRGLLPVTTPVDPVAAVVALQAIPVAAASRIVRRSLRRDGKAVAGWRKVPR